MYRIVVLMLLVEVANSSSIFNLNDRQVIETHLSSRDFNRISIDNDRITQTFYDRDHFKVVEDKINGQIFVKPAEPEGIAEKEKVEQLIDTFQLELSSSPSINNQEDPNYHNILRRKDLLKLQIEQQQKRLEGLEQIIKKKENKHPLGFTITTENNKTQDWLFTFKDVKSRTLILQEDKREVVKSLDCKEQAVKLLNKLVKHENIKGMVKNRKNIPVTSGWKLTRLKYVKLGNFIGHVLSLQNTTNQAREIKVKELWRDELVAISLDRPKVESGDYVRVIMVTEGQGLPSVKHVNNTTTKKHEPHPLDWYVNRGDV